jgi:uncharacterized Zn finger protein (UPF0148 family)
MTLARVACACGWQGRRKPGRLVFCPLCDQPAAFQPEDAPRNAAKMARSGPLSGQAALAAPSTAAGAADAPSRAKSGGRP